MGKTLLRSLLILAGLWLASGAIAYFVAEGLWFDEVEYFNVFLVRVKTEIGIWAATLGVSFAFLGVNFALSDRCKYGAEHPVWEQLVDRPLSQKTPNSRRRSTYLSRRRLRRINTPLPLFRTPKPITPSLGLNGLLGLAIALGTMASVIVFHYTQVAIDLWRPDFNSAQLLPTVPPRLDWWQMWDILRVIPEDPVRLVLIGGTIAAILFFPELVLRTMAVILSVSFAVSLSAYWPKVLQFANATPFREIDPQYKLDIGFYIFKLPIWELLEFWSVGLFGFSVAAISLCYLLSGKAIEHGKFPGLTLNQQRHLYALGGLGMLAVGLSYWMQHFELLYSPRGVTYGASFTDVNVQLPANLLLFGLAIAIAILLLFRAVFSIPLDDPKKPRSLFDRLRYPFVRPPYALVSYVALVAIVGFLVPAIVQGVVVQPNEIDLETPYIRRSLQLTRQGFDLNAIEVVDFNPKANLTIEDIEANDFTINNVRLWDRTPLLQTNRQLQQIRLYYKFLNADIDRYRLFRSPTPENPNPSEKRQVILSARELDYDSVAPDAKTWVNEHLVYTHGYGFTMSPVNTAAPSGLPEYYVKGIATDVDRLDDSPVQVSDERIRASIPIGKPRIYYGELTNTYVMTSSNVQELDYPRGDDNVYNTYDGSGGISLGHFWRRWIFARYLNDWRMLFTDNFTADTKLLFRRNVAARVRAIAPFLRFDNDPYLVIADADFNDDRDPTGKRDHLYWIIDAYTTSDAYPYSDPGNYPFNYIRNSVKTVVDAYNGSVRFYVANETDPIVRTLEKIFPGTFQPLAYLPPTLRAHIRYPVDLFNAQSDQLLSYHMTDARVFYNREDQWEVSTEIYRDEPQEVEPYYLIMKLPTAASEEFVLLHPFTPVRRNNMIAWLAGRSDGRNYGKMILYKFPKQELIYGPRQIEARINQDPIISQQLSLWNQRGSRVIQGNLLVIPIEESLLYVEPIYLKAEQDSLPTLTRVVVAYANQIAMAPTLRESLNAIFLGEGTDTPAILRSVDDLLVPVEEP